jgi:hypothetical protein
MSDDEDQAWADLLSEIGIYMEVVFAVGGRDKEVWQYIVAQASHLEHLAAVILWEAAGRPTPFKAFEPDLTLGRAARQLESQRLLDTTTIETLKAVARLRNSVTHRGAVYGVGWTDRMIADLDDEACDRPPSEPGAADRGRGMYKGGHVFTEVAALWNLANDSGAVLQSMHAWVRQRRRGE